jgi:hypothetical protein
MTVTERIQQESCVYEAAFPPSVPEGRLLREAQVERERRLLRRMLRLTPGRSPRR